MANRGFCVHGHFYQPPREDPLTGIIPIESGASPFRNWNERIHAECYRPNAESGNFEHISFNVGPTLFNWMAQYDPLTTSRIISQDRVNYLEHNAGNAMAQAYNHTILPLASYEDKVTQVAWGIADFAARFGHKPAGLWLPETAVDLETLEVMADHGIEFTILAPWQADQKNLDTNQPYWVDLSKNRRMAVFFYNQDLSTRVSFDPASTINADSFVDLLLEPKFRPPQRKPGLPGAVVEDDQICIIASDGELYGHHQKFRDKFLAYLLDGAVKGHTFELTYPARWLQQHPPTRTVKLHDKSSWSCHHGVVRWKGECGCTPGSTWKAPLRRGLNRIAALVDSCYAAVIEPYGVSPWVLRNNYIHVRLGQVNMEHFLDRNFRRHLENDEVQRITLLLAGQYERQRVFTSCGWFFDEFDRIEPRNNIAYAAQAVWLTAQATGQDLKTKAQAMLNAVKSTRTGLQGSKVFAEKYALAEANAASYLRSLRTKL
ncbi:MAG TPA: DUF3536 domain-containing protein [Anaerolineaceae bacterium]|nr:DUF3536 domain-containing protein [Anaerolineaceae bacterium]HPN53994.1 DUF3536 domain-containing protein [Anaerolineaceae bacterium]